ncbi:hypothetical protein HK098_005420 [Nowakowskiella sp. JEL0407]|nr:hypothetical protein HK098_005420 [Nowakowskiella sp. JEL0407]
MSEAKRRRTSSTHTATKKNKGAASDPPSILAYFSKLPSPPSPSVSSSSFIADEYNVIVVDSDPEDELPRSIPESPIADTETELDEDHQEELFYNDNRKSYLEQMQMFIATVLESEKHLFTESEIETSFKFIRLSKIKWKSETNSISDACTELCSEKLRFAKNFGPDSLSEWLDILTKDELMEFAKNRKIPYLSKKKVSEIRLDLQTNVTSQSTLSFSNLKHKENNVGSDRLLSEIKRLIGPVIILNETIRDLFHRLFIVYNRTMNWPDRDQFMTNSILTNLRKDPRKFPDYEVYRIDLTWPTKEIFDEYVRLLKLERDVVIARDAEDKSETMLLFEQCLAQWETVVSSSDGHVSGVSWLQVFTPGWVLTRILHHSIEYLHSAHEYQKEAEILEKLISQRLYCRSNRGFWYDQFALVLHNYIEKERAWEIGLEALRDPFVQTAHERSIQKRLRRLKKDLKKRDVLTLNWLTPSKFDTVKVSAKKVFSEKNYKAMWEGENNEPVGVEELVLQHYRRDAAPLDLGTEFFFDSRSKEIESRLDEIESGGFTQIITRIDDTHRPLNTFCTGVNWKRFEKQDILEISECMGGSALSNICRLFAQTYWAHRGGVPDLCIWKYEEKKVKLVEVKGDTDRLSENQKVWMDFLAVFNIDVEEFQVKSN